jgi:hypothetical protein
MSATMEAIGGPWDGELVTFPNHSPDGRVDVPAPQDDPFESPRMVGCYRPDFHSWQCFWYPTFTEGAA